MDETWSKLSNEAKLLAKAVALSYRKSGTVSYSLNDLRMLTNIRGRTVLHLLSELASRDYGQLDGGQTNPIFTINQPRFQSILASDG